MTALDAAERLKQDVGALLDAGRTAARDYGGVGVSFRQLLLADLSLARLALIRGLVFLLVCAIAIGTAWAVGMTMLVVGLHATGLSWLMALLLPLALSLAIAWVAWSSAQKSLAMADLDATRRQLSYWFPPTPEPTPTPTPTPAPPGEPAP